MLFRLVGVLVFLIAVCFSTAFADELPDLVSKGRQAFDKGNYDEAARYAKSAMEAAERSGDSALLAGTLGEFGRVLLAKGEFAESKRFSLRALDILKRNPPNRYLSVVLNSLGMVSSHDGDFADAERYIKDALRTVQALDPHDPYIAQLLNNLGAIYYKSRAFGAAEKASQKAISFMEKEFGREDVRLGPILNNFAGLQISMKKWSVAEVSLDRALTLAKNSGNYLEIANVLENMGAMRYARKGLPEAEDAYRRAFTIRLEVLGAGNPDVARTALNLAGTLTKVGNFSEAERLYLEALQSFERTFGDNSREVLLALSEMAQLMRKTNRPADAAELESRAASIRFELHRVVRADELR